MNDSLGLLVFLLWTFEFVKGLKYTKIQALKHLKLKEGP